MSSVVGEHLSYSLVCYHVVFDSCIPGLTQYGTCCRLEFQVEGIGHHGPSRL